MRHVWVLAFLVAAGCVESASVVCGDDVCPAGTQCDLALGRCLTPDQLAACDGHADGDVCTLQGGAGECRAGACERPVCGDGQISGAEGCDGVDLGGETCASLGFASETTGLRCNDLCRFDTTGCAGICGDGNLEPGEICDGSANPDDVSCDDVGFYARIDALPVATPLTCGALCGWDTTPCADYCGDGVINGPELCDGAPPTDTCVDLGFDAGRTACSGICGAEFAGCARFGFRASFVAPALVFGFHAQSANAQWMVGAAGFTAHRVAGGWDVVPTPVTTAIVSVWTVSSTRAWAVASASAPGGEPALLRFTGGAWELIPGAPALSLAKVWGDDQVAVIATSDGVHRWSAAGWARVGTLSGAIKAIGGTSATDLFAAALDGVHHWDGTAWTRTTTVRLVALDVRGPSDVYGVGRTGDANTPSILARWDGLAWTISPLPLPVQTAVLGVSARALNDVWIRLPSGRLLHFDGQRWVQTRRVLPDAAPSFADVVAIEGGEVVGATTNGYAADYRGQAMMTPVDIPSGLSTVAWFDGDGGAFFANAAGEVLHDDGFVVSPTAVTTTRLGTIWGTSPQDVYVGGAAGAVYHFDGASWTGVTTGLSSATIEAIVGRTPADVWVFASTFAAHFDGQAWTAQALPPGKAARVAAMVDGELWVAAATNELYRWDGTAFVLKYTAPATVRSIAIVSPTNIYVATLGGLVHSDGTAFATVPGLNMSIEAVSGSADDDVLALTTAGTLHHYDGIGWTPVRVPATRDGEISGIHVQPNGVDLVFRGLTLTFRRTLFRTRPWTCRASETGACSDGVDNDCDGVLDALDPDCP